MNICTKDKTLEFKQISLKYIDTNINNVYYFKNNKTLLETLEHYKYSRLKSNIENKYHAFLNTKLGDFMRHLKESGDKNYLLFLNKYGDNKFCEFRIDQNLDDRGIYCFIHEGKIKYVGRCTDSFHQRINQGYGKIHPKNCFIDGQATNCHLNSLINSCKDVQIGLYIMNDKSIEEIKQMEKLILNSNRFDWNIQTS